MATFSSVAPPPTSRKLAGAAPAAFRDVQRRHRQARSVNQAADAPVQAHVGDVVVRCPRFQLVFLGAVAQFAQVGMAEQGVVLNVHLGVKGDHAAVAGYDQWVHLHQRAIVVGEYAIKDAQYFGALSSRSPRHAQSGCHSPALEWHQAQPRLNGLGDNGLRVGGGNLFDRHSRPLRWQ